MAARSHRKLKPAKHRHHRAAPHLVPKHKSSKPSILVADDDIDARTMYGMFLKSRGCEVYPASDGAGAIRQAMAVHPDLIVLDLAMPNIDGWAAAERLGGSAATGTIP